MKIAPRVIDSLEKMHRELEFFGGSSNEYAILQASYGCSLGFLGEFEKGDQLCEKALSFAHKINHFVSIALAELFYGMLFANKGDGENAVKHLQSSIEYGEKSQAAYMLGHAWGYLGFGYFLLGELETALKFTEKGLKMLMDVGFPVAFVHRFLSYIHFNLGNLNEAKVHAEQALNLAQTNHQKCWEGISWLRLGRILGKIEGPQLPKAEEYILQGMKILNELGTKPYYAQGHLFLGELYGDAGQKEKALKNLKKAEAMFQEMGMDYWLARTKKLLEMATI